MDDQEIITDEELYQKQLNPLRTELNRIDLEVIELLKERSSIVGDVGKLKQRHGKGLQASDREAAMFQKLENLCDEKGLDRGYILELWSLIIWNSKIEECKVTGRSTFMNSNAVPPEDLRQNLINLTTAVAPTYPDYCFGDWARAIRKYRAREEHAFGRTVSEVCDHERAIDLGCASGQFVELLEKHFQRVDGFDISDDMIKQAQARRSWKPGVHFKAIDLERRIPVEDESISYVVANFGAASEMGPCLFKDSPDFLQEVRRVLKPGGKALLSFYNKDALLNQWFYPWPSTIHARPNPLNNTIEVWAANTVFTVHAKSETVPNLKSACRCYGLEPEFWESYPTLGAVIPHVFYDQDALFGKYVESIEQIDSHLARSKSPIHQGTYILTIVTKK